MSDKTKSAKIPDPGVLGEIARTARLVIALMADARVPILPKLIIPLVILYVVSPLDLVPDFILGLGQLDDIAIIFFGIKFFIQLCPPDLVMEHRRKLVGDVGSTGPDYVDGTFRVVDNDKK